jgi:hypothetical protein
VGRSGFDPRMQFRVDNATRSVIIDLADGPPARLDAWGFEAGTSASAADASMRGAARTQAYETLRSALRLEQTGFKESALQMIDDAVAAADRARDVPLGVWCRRVRVRMTITAGRGAVVEPLLRDVMTRFQSPADACWDAATAFQLHGEPLTAARWYREGLHKLTDSRRGRTPSDFLEGLVFALAQAKHWGEAERAVTTFRRAFPVVIGDTDTYVTWVRWRSTGTFPKTLKEPDDKTDFPRYVALESQAADPANEPARIIERIDAALPTFSGIYAPAARSLKAVLLSRAGKRADARALATAALADAKALWNEEADARVHTQVIEERVRMLNPQGGL